MADKRIVKIADAYGLEEQTRQCMEEMAELTQVLNKYYRYYFGKSKPRETKEVIYKNVVEEIADVQIMLSQMVYLFNCQDEIKKVMQSKLNNLVEKIESEEQ